jgi:branched-chain amino acid transport system permease protein
MTLAEPGELIFFLSVLIEGVLSGAVYALIALAFVLVYKSSRMVNFAVGDWLMAGTLTAGVGYYAFGFGPLGAILFAVLGMAAFGLAFNATVVRRLAAGPVISAIMATLGLGALMRGLFPIIFHGIPAGVRLPIPPEPLRVCGVIVSPEKLTAAARYRACPSRR